MEQVETIERWRYEKLRAAVVLTLAKVTSVLRAQETGENESMYEDTVGAAYVLAKALDEVV